MPKSFPDGATVDGVAEYRIGGTPCIAVYADTGQRCGELATAMGTKRVGSTVYRNMRCAAGHTFLAFGPETAWCRRPRRRVGIMRGMDR